MATAGLSRRIARAVAWSGLNTLLTRLITIVVGAIAVRLMSHHDFGSYSVALAVYLVISGFSEFGLSAALARADLDPDEIGPSVSLLSIVVSLFTSAGLALAAHPIAVALGAPDATGPLRVLALCLLLTGVLTVPTGLLIREFRQEAFLVANLVCFVPSNALLIFLAARGDGALAFAWSRVADSVITGVVLVVFAKKLYRPRLHRDVAGSVLRFGIPVAGANLVRFVLLNAEYLFISRLMGPAALGIYTLAFNVSSWASSVLGGIIFSVAMPAISHDKGDPVRLRSSLRHSVALVSLVAFPLVAVSIGLAHPLVGFIYGPRWGASAAILEILGVYGALFVLALLLGNVLTGLGLSGRLFILQVVWLAALMPAMAIGVHLDGLKGAALAHVATMLVIVIPAHLLALRRQVHGLARVVG
ncbi:MAG: oligosaccharide flippase family protein, partial [Nocardioidaceae bacterium]